MSQCQRNPYEILGVGLGVSEEEIRKKYREFCKRFHPDLNQGDPRAVVNFRAEQSAYETLLCGMRRKGLYRETTGHSPGDRPVSDLGKPFFGFFHAVRAYCMRMNPDKDS
ncbi:MAG: J domain-containing protein [Desulfomonile tiedjei]|nr:J domain-containing protein [Desulfomonile tiedjei]